MKPLIFIIGILLSSATYAQEFYQADLVDQIIAQHDRTMDGDLNLSLSTGMSFDLGWRRNGSLRLFVNVGFMQRISDNFILTGQSEIEVFRGGLGSSVQNNEKFRFNIEMRNSIGILAGTDGGTFTSNKPAMVNVNDNYAAIYDPFAYSLSLGTTFINGLNHKRHQQIGIGSFSIKSFVFQYYNDATPYSSLGLADKFDRYWTGGGMAGLYFINDPRGDVTHLVVRYDNYTGYQRNLYEIAGVLGIDNLPYENIDQQMFNQARYKYSLGFKGNTSFNFSVWEPLQTDIQYLIHYHISISPFHARPLEKRRTFGVNYNRLYKL